MAAQSTPKRLNHFCRKYINPKIQKRIDDAIEGSDTLSSYPVEVLELLLHDPADSGISTWLKLAIYYFEFNGLGNLVEPGVEIAAIYGMPVDSIQESVRWIPQVKIFFRENPQEAWEDKRRPRISEMTIRLSHSLTEALKASGEEIKPLATIIAELFKGITYKKGYQKYHYRDLDNNYRLSVFTDTQAEAETLFTALLAINSDIPNFSSCLVYPQTTKDYGVTETKSMLGQSIIMPNERTEANMQFWRAELHWKGIPPIILVNNSIKNRGAIIELKYP